jgi:addiction module RelE/StbE family toxin
MARVVFTPTAQAHLQEIYRYIAQDSPRAAKHLARRLRAEAARLADHPEMGRIVPEYRASTIRELIVGSYRLICRVDDDGSVVRIAGIIHGSRLLPRLPETDR